MGNWGTQLFFFPLVRFKKETLELWLSAIADRNWRREEGKEESLSPYARVKTFFFFPAQYSQLIHLRVVLQLEIEKPGFASF